MIDYGVVLGDLIARRDELNVAISAIANLVPKETDTAPVKPFKPPLPEPRTVEEIKAQRRTATEDAIAEVRQQVDSERSGYDFVNDTNGNGAVATVRRKKVANNRSEKPLEITGIRRCNACGQKSGGSRSTVCQHCFEPF